MLSCPTGQKQNQGTRARGKELSSLRHAGPQPRKRLPQKRWDLLAGRREGDAVAAPEQSREQRLSRSCSAQAGRQGHFIHPAHRSPAVFVTARLMMVTSLHIKRGGPASMGGGGY